MRKIKKKAFDYASLPEEDLLNPKYYTKIRSIERQKVGTLFLRQKNPPVIFKRLSKTNFPGIDWYDTPCECIYVHPDSKKFTVGNTYMVSVSQRRDIFPVFDFKVLGTCMTCHRPLDYVDYLCPECLLK